MRENGRVAVVILLLPIIVALLERAHGGPTLGAFVVVKAESAESRTQILSREKMAFRVCVVPAWASFCFRERTEKTGEQPRPAAAAD